MSKTIRLQIDITYTVNDDIAQNVYNYDINFFNDTKQSAEQWNNNPKEPRHLVNYEFRHSMGEDNSNEEE